MQSRHGSRTNDGGGGANALRIDILWGMEAPLDEPFKGKGGQVRTFRHLLPWAGAVSTLALATVATSPAKAAETGSGMNTETQSHVADDLRAQAASQFNFAIAPGPLGMVLDQIAAQSGSRYSLARAAVAGISSPGVKGRMGLAAAVARALEGTGWKVASLNSGEIRLARVDAGGSQDEIVVSARLQGFKENFSSVASHTNTPLRETPSTVDVVTKDILESQNAFSLGEAVRNIPGAIFQAGGSPNQVRLGPTTTAGVTFTNGLQNGALADNLPTVMVDSIEVLKGPSSLLTGTEVSGGLLNYVLKKANGITPQDISIGVGSDFETIASADVSGSVPLGEHLYYRMIGFAQHAQEGAAGGNNPYQYVLSPMIGYRSDNTTFDLGGQYFQQRDVLARKSFTAADGSIIPFGDSLPPDSAAIVDFKQVSYGVEHTFVDTPDWTMKLKAEGLYQTGTATFSVAQPSPSFRNPLAVVAISFYEPNTTNSDYIQLYNKFDTGPIQHQLIVAGSYYGTSDSQYVGDTVSFVTLGSPAALPDVVRTGDHIREVSHEFGAIIQDQMTWGPLHAMVGVRKSWYKDKKRQASETDFTRETAQHWSPSGGLVLDVTKWASIYGQYSDSFSPVNPGSISVDGQIFSAPVVTKRYELGFKSSFFNDRLDVTGSVHKTKVGSEPVDDPNNFGFSILESGEREKGFEVSVSGSISPTFKITAGYAHDTGKFTGLGPIDQSPHNVANLWLLKTFKLGERSKINLGFGGNYHDGYYLVDANADPSICDTQPAACNGSLNPLTFYHRKSYQLNGTLGYAIEKYTVNLAVNNLLGRREFTLSDSNYLLTQAPGRTFRLVVDAKF